MNIDSLQQENIPMTKVEGKKEVTELQKAEISRIVDEKHSMFQQGVQGMMKNFHIEIIRQFEI
jgi:hypothetical protein